MGSSYILQVEGMTCGGCVASVQRVLAGVSGVSTVQVSLEESVARVTGAAMPVDPAALVRAVEAAGFHVGTVSTS